MNAVDKELIRLKKLLSHSLISFGECPSEIGLENAPPDLCHDQDYACDDCRRTAADKAFENLENLLEKSNDQVK